jgi:uncharacterized protein YhfF
MSDTPTPPVVEFAFPGPLRDSLVAAILSGAKTSTTSTLVEYSIENEPLPVVGSRQTVVDSDDTGVAVIETTSVEIVPLASVDLQHALDEGEGYTTVAEWRSAHERYWQGEAMRAWLGDEEFTVDDETLVVLERFRLVAVL